MLTYNENAWHSDTLERFRALSRDELEYIREDAYQAAKVGDAFGNPKAGQYWDEYHYACMALKERSASKKR